MRDRGAGNRAGSPPLFISSCRSAAVVKDRRWKLAKRVFFFFLRLRRKKSFALLELLDFAAISDRRALGEISDAEATE